MVRGIVQIGTDRQARRLVIVLKLRGNKRIAQRDVTAGGKKHFLPDAHVLIRRRGIPIHPSNSEVVLPGSRYFDGQGIWFAGVERLAYVELKGRKRSRDVFSVGDLLPVEPDIGAV